MERAIVAQTVANELLATEMAIDEALVRASKLLSKMVEARREMDLSAVMGDDAFASISQAIAGLSAARTATVAGHHQLEDVKLRLGVRTKMTGIKAPSKTAPTLSDAEAASIRRAV